MCPLVDHKNHNYVPDLVDLTKDEEARNYWLNCFERTIETVKKLYQQFKFLVIKTIDSLSKL